MIEVREDLALDFVRQVERLAEVEFDPDSLLETRFTWALGYVQGKLQHVPDRHRGLGPREDEAAEPESGTGGSGRAPARPSASPLLHRCSMTTTSRASWPTMSDTCATRVAGYVEASTQEQADRGWNLDRRLTVS